MTLVPALFYGLRLGFLIANDDIKMALLTPSELSSHMP